MSDIALTFKEFSIPLLSEEELTKYQKDFPNLLWRRNNYKKPNILINEFSRTITFHDSDDTVLNTQDLFFHQNNHKEINTLVSDLIKQISKLKLHGLEVIEKLMSERSNELGSIRFIDGVSIGDEVRNIVAEMRYLEKSAIAIRYKIVQTEIKIKDLEYVSAELLAMEMSSVL
ncbi:hypothetical protein QEN19_001019 [Hanseniaspora menglaensis]